MNRILIDLSDHRLRLDQLAVLSWATGETPLDGAILDTGSAFAVLGPESMIGGNLPADAQRSKINGFGDKPIPAICFPCTLAFPDTTRIFEITAHVSSHPSVDRWYIGLPILKHFDILLRSSPRDIHRPALEW